MDLDAFIRDLPKAELHVHIEGTLEPELLFQLAERNQVALPYSSVDEVRAAYEFTNLQSFLDIYYQGAAVLITEQDFADLMAAYLERASADGVRHAEIFFDPQTHTERGIGFSVFMDGFARAQREAEERLGITSSLILCFLRHLSSEEAVETLEAARPYLDHLVGVGLDSSEVGNPPERFAEAFELAGDLGLHRVAHAGEEGPPAYIRGALDVLGAERIDHGVRLEDDDDLLARVAKAGVPLTMCPLSNVKLRVFDVMGDHNLKRLLDRGVKVTVNSDDPAYFGGYIGDNYLAVAEALDLSLGDIAQIARNSIEATFLPNGRRESLLAELDQFVV
ncbi:MAG: adenosine deaminase [Acidimicrobiia bacterium]|nr:adenosine deaminase [Acidimicrobiia bacterium]MBT8193018.1 adenosine deaminase [Acidimicrobiia bacterium]NNF87635.1 adenosine deaminase [Acidimicrobiia bacterium]NNL97148.1 adenosine deaminase [Acidimicrobiia bacterium]RZV46428.1 MAG: adenosine deaminase [Acidimicrobiia bacterium]